MSIPNEALVSPDVNENCQRTPKRRRSLRETNVRAEESSVQWPGYALWAKNALTHFLTQRLLWDKTSLYARRLDQLFFSKTPNEGIIKIGHIQLTSIHSNPHIYVINNFLSVPDLEYWQALIEKSRFERSYVDASTNNTVYDATHRTSTFVSCRKAQDSKIALLEHRVAALMGCFCTSIEPLQLVRYRENEFFGVHHDMGDYDEETGEVTLPPKSLFAKRRLVTIFCYLNSVEQGGETEFPACCGMDHQQPLRVQPVPGRAVVFANVTSDGQAEARTIHAGLPVSKGVKYGLNIWICEE